MFQIRIEHTVPDYAAWKKLFDGDPVGRAKSGVRHYAIGRAVDEPNHVTIDLDLPTREQADAMLGALRAMWAGLPGGMMRDARVRIAEVVETRDL